MASAVVSVEDAWPIDPDSHRWLASGADPGDLSSLEEPSTLDAIRNAR